VHASGILHRDIKPNNIGYTVDGIPKLLDFGLAAILDGSIGAHTTRCEPATERHRLDEIAWTASPTTSLTVTNQLVGTPLYLSPEAADGQPAEPSFDLWSLSLVLYQAYAGRHPLAGLSTMEVLEKVRRADIPDIRTIRPDCPEIFAELLGDALSPTMARRPASAGDLRIRLRSIQNRLYRPALLS